MNMTINRGLAGVLTLALGGCVGPVEIAPLPYAHPAQPDAPAGTVPEVGSALHQTHPIAASEAATSTGMSHGNMNHQPANTNPAQADGRFQCPMHAEVRSDKPGRCPVCGMNLVEQEKGTEHKGHHER